MGELLIHDEENGEASYPWWCCYQEKIRHTYGRRPNANNLKDIPQTDVNLTITNVNSVGDWMSSCCKGFHKLILSWHIELGISNSIIGVGL